jgi:Cdc6-like AAA superfamily ATPase
VLNVAGKVLNYYAGGNTARGFHNLFESNLQNLNRLFILKGGPGTGKSSLMKKVGEEWLQKGYGIEYIHCSSDNDSIDGVIIPALKAGIVDGTAPHVIEPKVPGAVENYINLGEAWDANVLAGQKAEIKELTNNISKAFASAYAVFNEALKVHDEWEKIYIDNMDFEKANKLTNTLLEDFFGNIVLNKKSVVKHRFLGAATPKGAVNFVQNLTEDVPKRYFIKGRPGSGKSTLLKKIAAKAEETGFDAEVYHCGFDPNSLDMVIIRELGICIFDSTAPHEFFPSREGDEIVDMYQSIIEPNTDEIFADKIEMLSKEYRFKMKEATSYLKLAKSLHDELEKIYVQAMDFSIVDRLTEKITDEFKRLAEITV